MSRTGPYKPPPIGRKALFMVSIAIVAVGLLMFAAPNIERGVGATGPIAEGVGVLVILAGVGVYAFSRRWSQCPHCGVDVKRTEPVCPNCGKRIFGETT